MTTSPTQLKSALSEDIIKPFWLGYFQEDWRESIQSQLLEAYEARKATTGFTKADLAKKIGKRPEQITRWLMSPCNLEGDTVSDLALGLGFVPKFSLESVKQYIDAPYNGTACDDNIVSITFDGRSIQPSPTTKGTVSMVIRP